MRLRIWGVRGSLATPMGSAQLRQKLERFLGELTPDDLATPASRQAALDRSCQSWTYGGNTSCLTLEVGGSLFVLDAGTGLRNVSNYLAEQGRLTAGPIHMLFTHFHWDHICGLPFFVPIYIPGRAIQVWSGRSDADELLAVQMGGAHFPVKWPTLPSRITCQQLEESTPAVVDGVKLRILPLLHPDKAFGYRLSAGGRSVCYLTDTEVSRNPNQLAPTYRAFVEGADVVVVDAMYGFLEYHDKINYGHSTIFNWIDFFANAQIGELVIFHHDPNADDEAVSALLQSAERYRQLVAPRSTWKLSAAREGQEWDLAGS
jgi:ribonuclease BN (tRNA processing enzyme)